MADDPYSTAALAMEPRRFLYNFNRPLGKEEEPERKVITPACIEIAG